MPFWHERVAKAANLIFLLRADDCWQRFYTTWTQSGHYRPFQYYYLSRYDALQRALGDELEAARVHYSAWRRGGFVATRGAGAATSNAGDWDTQRVSGCDRGKANGRI